MRIKYAKRFLAGLMCVSIVFQSSSVTAFAAGADVQKEVQESAAENADSKEQTVTKEAGTGDSESTEPSLTEKKEAEAAENPGSKEEIAEAAENAEAKEEETEATKGSEAEEGAAGAAEGPEIKEEAAEAAEKTEATEETAETIENAEIEQNTAEAPETEAVEADGVGEVQGEFEDVSVEFDGYYAEVSAAYAPSSDAQYQFYLVSYKEDGIELTSSSIKAYQDPDTGTYRIDGSVEIYNEAQSVSLKAVEMDGDGVEIGEPAYSDEFVREQFPTFHFSVGELDIGAGSVTVPFWFDGDLHRPEGKPDKSYTAVSTLKYGIESVDEKSSGSRYGNFKDYVSVDGLEADTAYQAELLITILGPDNGLGNIYEQTIALDGFKTLENEAIDLAEAFPDEVFRGVIRESLNLEDSETTVDRSQLEKITRLSSVRRDITAPAIKDITGIELLCNLTDIDLSGHEITDVSGIAWEKFTKLFYLNLKANCIEEMPNLTRNTRLAYLYISDNFIPTAEIRDRQDKLPEGFDCNGDYSQRYKEFQLITEEKYYRADGKSEIALRVQGYNEWFLTALKVYIDDNAIELKESSNTDEDGYRNTILYNEDIPYGTGSHTLKFEMYQSGSAEPRISEEVDFEIVELQTFIADQYNAAQQTDVYYMSTQQESLSVHICGVKEVSEISLIKDGVIYGKSDSVDSYEGYQSFNKYPSIGNYYSSASYYSTNAYVYSNKRVMQAGTYDLKLRNKDGTEELLEGTVKVVDAAVIKDVSAGYSYDNTGEYLYLALTTDCLDPSKINYTVRDANTRKALQTEYVDYKPFYDGYVVKLKKTGWDSGITSISVRFSGKEDYQVYIAGAERYLGIDHMLYFGSYNYQTNMLEVGLTSQTKLSDCTYSIVRTDLPWDFSTEHIQEEYTVRFEEVEDTIYNVIPAWEGEDCTLYGGYYRFEIIRRIGDSEMRESREFYIPGLVIERARRLYDDGYWSNAKYNLIQQGIGRVSHTYYSEIDYVEGNAEDFEAQIVGSSLDTPLDAQSVYTWNHSSDTYKTEIGMEFDYSYLEVGEYTIELYYRSSLLAEYEIQVIPNDVFVLYDDSSAYWSSEDTFYMTFWTPNCGEDDDYTISLTDLNGKEVEGLTISNLYKYASSPWINCYVSGLKRSEADRGYYIKLLHKTKGEAYCEDLKTEYYKGHGKYTKIYDNSYLSWNQLWVSGRNYGHTGVCCSDKEIFPATFSIYRFNSTELVYSTEVTEEDFDGSYYYFTQDVIDALPRSEGFYDLVFVGANGQSIYAQQAQVTLNEAIWDTFRVVPSSMTLKLDNADESAKKITAFNCSETPKFESDDTTVADVTVSEEDPTIAIVEAVGVGRTSITVTSGSSIKKVTVVVTETPVEAEKIAFSAETIKVVQGMTAAATVRVEPEKAWISSSRISYASSDETVVSVGDSTTRNITLTAKNPGTATITAELEGTGLTAQCSVTVVAGMSDAEQKELVSAVGALYFLEGAENTLADIKLPEGWRWSNPSQRPTADDGMPAKEFTAVYAKDGLDYFQTPLSVFVTKVNTKITGVTEMHVLTSETFKCMYEFVGYKPADNTTYAASFKWEGNDGLKVQGADDRDEVTVQAGAAPGNYALQCKLFVKNTKTGEEFTETLRNTIAVKDDTDEINEAIKNRTYYFLSGADSRLGDIPIGEGWSWVRPDTVPQTDVSIPVQSFEAQYVAPGMEPVKAMLSVAVTALGQVNITGAAKIAAERTGSYRLDYQFSGYDINDAGGYEISYRWKGGNGIAVDGADTADTVTIRTGSTAGAYTLSAEVTVKNRQTGNTSKADGSYRIQVMEKGSIDGITIRPAETQPEKALACAVSNGALESDYTAFDKADSFRIQLVADTTSGGVAKDIPVRWASSDPKVASINDIGLVTVKNAGIAVITATSTDSGAYSEEIVLKIQDFTPALENKAITVFQYSSMGTEIGLTAQYNNRIQSIEVSASGLKAAEQAGVWYLQASGYAKKTVENTKLTIATEKGKYEKSLKVTVDVTQPKASLKQSVKPNIFYTDAEAVYKVTSKYAIERIEDASGASDVCFHVKDYDAEAGLLTLEPYGIRENIARYKAKDPDALKAKIKVTFEGYTAPVEMTVKVGITDKKPSLRIDTAVLIKDTGMDETLTVVRNGKTVYHLGYAAVESKTENVSASVSGGKLRLNYSGTSNVTYKVDIKDENWAQAATVSGKIQMVNADTLGLQAETTKITVNKANLQSVVIPVAIKGNSALEPGIQLDYDNTAMTAVYRNGAVEIAVSENAQDKTYKVEVGGTLEAAGRTVDVKKAVIKITVTGKEASVKLFASGKINIADRKYSATTYTPTLKNMDANIVGAEVTGDMAEYFYAYLDETEKVVLKAISGKPLKAGTKYAVDIAVSFDNGYQTVAKVNIKPINKLPKVKASLTKGTLYKSSGDCRLGIKLTLDARYQISQVRLTENPYSEYFTLSRDESGLVTIALSKNGVKMPSGTYTVSYQVLIADADNTKPITRNLKITVK